MIYFQWLWVTSHEQLRKSWRRIYICRLYTIYQYHKAIRFWWEFWARVLLFFPVSTVGSFLSNQEWKVQTTIAGIDFSLLKIIMTTIFVSRDVVEENPQNLLSAAEIWARLIKAVIAQIFLWATFWDTKGAVDGKREKEKRRQKVRAQRDSDDNSWPRSEWCWWTTRPHRARSRALPNVFSRSGLNGAVERRYRIVRTEGGRGVPVDDRESPATVQASVDRLSQEATGLQRYSCILRSL